VNCINQCFDDIRMHDLLKIIAGEILYMVDKRLVVRNKDWFIKYLCSIIYESVVQYILFNELNEFEDYFQK